MATTTVRSVGGLLPVDVLLGVVSGSGVPGVSGDAYGLELGVSPREAANRSWAVLVGAWRGFRLALELLPEGDRATSLTREKWLYVLLRELGFGHRPNAAPAGGLVAEGRVFPVSHVTDDVVLHLLGWGVGLDQRTAKVAGAADRAPHSMVQELLNRSDAHLWAMVSNGRRLRLLRDSTSMVGAAYVEFDLEAMFDGEVFSDFVLLFLTCHYSRFRPIDAEKGPADCWLERWRTYAAETGTRALADLRVGVRKAIAALGTGFTSHSANTVLRGRLERGEISADDVKRALLRVVYRLLFCFVAEDRGLLLDPSPQAAIARRRYNDWFSTARLRRIATKRHGGRHGDLWRSVSIVFDALGDEQGRAELALVGLGGLFEHGLIDVFADSELSNEALLAAVRHLCVVIPKSGPRRLVDYRNLGSEELGSVYESLLELVPRYDSTDRAFTLEEVAGNERKKTGSYYTPSSLISCLLDSALDPLLVEAEHAVDPESALLAITVCDPACGSGHFLVAAARRIAVRLARVRCGDAEPGPFDEQMAMYDVVSRCIYGVDLNDMAAELAKVSLWLEAVVPGRPLNFLDAHIKVGNALLGATPALLAAGLPDEAFTAIGNDDKAIVTALKKRNKTERDSKQAQLFVPATSNAVDPATAALDSGQPLSLADIHVAARRLRDSACSPSLLSARRSAAVLAEY